ncbi:MAG: hypothetical protein KGJ86_02230 [Chloroflexota bacterium]|nr:hypothetical protein [Chloroflexota bacterium]
MNVRRVARLLLPLMLLLVAFPAHAAAGWTVALTDKPISQLAVDQHNNLRVYAAGNDANQNAYVYRSEDGGISWEWAGTGLGQFTVFSFASSFTEPDRLLIGGWNNVTHTGALYKSSDAGNSWTSIGSLVGNQPAQAVGFGNDTAETMFVGTDLALWVSYDSGNSFSQDRAGLCPTPNVHAFAGDYQEPGTLYFGLDAGTCGGVFTSPDSGKVLFVASNGLPGFNPTTTVLKLAADINNGTGLALAGVPSAARVQTGPVPYSLWRTDNHGTLWTPVADTDPISGIVWDGANDFNVYYTSSSGLYVSHDQARTFNWASSAGAGGPVTFMARPARLLVGSTHGVAVFDLASGPISQTVPATSNPAPAAPGAAPVSTAGAKPVATPLGSGQSFTFPQTGHTVSGVWLDYLKSHGDVDISGYPRSEVIVDPLSGLTVQYFQRFVLEWHPELGFIQRRLLTDAIHPGLDAAVPNPGGSTVYFSQTGHSVSDTAPNGDHTGFLSFFLAHGHEATFAYPLEEPKMVNGRWTQRFQAAVMEAHAENPDPYKVQLELLGDEYIAAKGLGFK